MLTWALKKPKHLHFNGLLLTKVFNVWTKKVQRSYLSWHWRVMQYLKKNWVVVWKMTWGILQMFTRIPESLKIGTLIGSFYPKEKICWGVKCHDNEEWCKIRRGIDLSVKNWYEEFNKFWPEHSKISNISALMGWFSPKYTCNVWTKKVQRSYVSQAEK